MVMLKEGVKIVGLKPEAVLGIMICDGVYSKHGIDCVVTSATDSKHGRGSFHYLGMAFDLRTRDMDSNLKQEIVIELRIALGSEFDVVLESDHIHVEWNPK